MLDKSKIGRNDLCYCGSGKKYKRCCLDKDKLREKRDKAIEMYEEQYKSAYEYVAENEYEEERERARKYFFVCDQEDVNIQFEKYFNTYFLQDFVTENKRNVVLEYAEKNLESLKSTQKETVLAMMRSHLSIYQITDKTDKKVVLKDCITGKEYNTYEFDLFKKFDKDSYILTRITTIQGVNFVADVSINIQEETAKFIVEDFKQLCEKNSVEDKDLELFLLHQTHIFYRYVQQLLEPKVIETLVSENKASDIKCSNDNAKAMPTETVEKVCVVESLINAQISPEHVEESTNIWSAVKPEKMRAGSEPGWAAGIEYFVMKENNQVCTQAEVAKKYKVSTSTIGKRVKEIKTILSK